MTKKTHSLVRINGQSYLLPFILVTSLFLLWGFTHGLLDVLNKQFQDLLHISRARSGLLQFAFYGAYLVIAIPAGIVMDRFGYKRGILTGLFLFALGAFLFYPATHIQEFWFFLIALFIIGSGLTFLETAANPYSTVLGPSETAARRINLSQSFNGLGWILGPFTGGILIFSMSDSARPFDSLAYPYLGVGVAVLLVAVLFLRARLPEIRQEHKSGEEETEKTVQGRLLNQKHFTGAVVAQFLYVAAQSGIFSFFINYYLEAIYPEMTKPEQLSGLKEEASRVLAFGGMALFFTGRLSGSFIMKWVNANRVLAVYSFVNVVLMGIVIAQWGWWSVVSLFVSFFFMSIMFPTIFALGLKDLGPMTKKASSWLVMGVAGGALCPMLMGYIADATGMAQGFWVPLACFIVIGWYGWKGSQPRTGS